MITPRSFVPAAALVLAAAAQPASAKPATFIGMQHAPTRPAQSMQLQASLGAHILAAIRHVLAGDDTIHRG